MSDEDSERQPLIAKSSYELEPTHTKGDKLVPVKVHTLLELCQLTSKDVLAKINMASMQSPRTQCCCCAVGVFAAMFGIFMLSAGICIVLNVNYMEVDTSGLPPDLHNEDGKRIVGIILICVSLVTLGLSATVGIIYFAFCNRNNRSGSRHAAIKHPSSTTTNTPTHNHPNGSVHSSGHPHPTNKHVAKVVAMHKHSTANGGGSRGTPPGSITSLNAASGSKQRRSVSTPSGVLVPGPTHGQPPVASSKRGRRNNMKQKSKNHQRLRNRSFALPTHTEEDAEAAKSSVDLKSHQKLSEENSSNSGSSMAPSQVGSTITDDSRSAPYSTTSFINPSPNSPVIVIDAPTTQSSTSPALNNTHEVSSSNSTENNKSNSNNNSNDNNDTVVYNENEIARTTEKVTSSSTSNIPHLSSSSSSNHPSTSHSNPNHTDSSYSYTNPAFQPDIADINSNANTEISSSIPKGFQKSHLTREDSTTSTTTSSEKDRFSPPPPPSTSTIMTFSKQGQGQNSSSTTPAFPQYPSSSSTTENGNGINTTYPNPLLAAAELELDQEQDVINTSLASTTTDQDSVSSSNHSILQVKPHHNHVNPNPHTQSESNPNSNNADSITTETPTADLPESSRHNEKYHSNNSNNNNSTKKAGQYNVNLTNNNSDNAAAAAENRSESRSSFNSSLSTDADDSRDLEMVQEKMKELL